jgi:predicted RND superfamily exporter protein
MTRRLSLWWLLLLLVPGAAGLARLRFDVEVLNLLPANLPVVAGLKLHQRHFAGASELILTIHSRDAETAEAAARGLALALRAQTNLVSRALWQPPWRERPEEMAELLALTWLNQRPEAFAQLADRLAADKLGAAVEATRNQLATSLSPETIARLSYDPFGFSILTETVAAQAGGFGQGEGLFASGDGVFRLVFLKPAATLGLYRDCAVWLGRVRQVVEETRLAEGIPADVRVGYTGAPAFIAEISSGMERDLTRSATGTLLIVAVLFWAVHRRFVPLVWLTVMLLLVLAAILVLGGLIYGTLNVVSLGFAAILIGLAVDYAVVLYQASLDHSQASAADLRRRCTPAIAWSAVTTAGAFLMLNFAALPGLAQLGTLVALGILLAAVVMLFAFPPVAVKWRVTNARPCASAAPAAAGSGQTSRSGKWVWVFTFGVLVTAAAVLWYRPPAIDHSTEALNPTDSPAYTAMKEIESRFADTGEPLWVLVSGRDETEVGRRMETLEQRVRLPEVRQWLGTVTFPTALWPRPDRQRANRVTAMELIGRRDLFRATVTSAGFNEEAFQLADAILTHWEQTDPAIGALWPKREAGQWLLEKVAARTDSGWLALGIAQPVTNSVAAYTGAVSVMGDTLAENGAQLAGWSVLGEALLVHAEKRLPGLVVAMLVLVGVCLWLAFRDLREVLLSFAAMGMAFLMLLTLMSLLGWSWNLMNLMAAPLLLGASVDYTIHTQLALRGNGGNIAAFRRTTGRALLLAAATTIVGFASLAWAGNAGLASLGRLCAAGLACAFIVSVGLLPVWWRMVKPAAVGVTSPRKPSSLYRREIWWLGLWLGRVLPPRLCNALARALGWFYWRLQPQRRRVVIENLLPACHEDRSLAERAARQVFQEFAIKVADLWRFESGAPVDRELRSWSGWESFEAAQARGRGVLLVIPHLGNWEFGSPFLAARGVKLTVLTQAEPGNGFTVLRQKSRARWGIETIVVGEDAFAFVEIIKRLQNGATVALLVDRPPPSSAVTVQLFGRPFHASIAAAELARTTGCAIVPGYVLREPGGYAAHILPEIAYDRAAIGDRAARIRLTQEILRAFEPVIRQHVTQWYHFVPIWPEQPETRR